MEHEVKDRELTFTGRGSVIISFDSAGQHKRVKNLKQLPTVK